MSASDGEMGPVDPDGTPARAREIVDLALSFPPRPDTVDERERFFMGLMARGTYVTGETDKQAAEAWGLAVSTIHRDTATASRRLKSLVDRDVVRVRVASAFDEALDMARVQDDPRAIAAVGDRWAALVGANAPAKLDVRVTSAPDGCPPGLWERYQAGDPAAADEYIVGLMTNTWGAAQLEPLRALLLRREVAVGVPVLVEAVVDDSSGEAAAEVE